MTIETKYDQFQPHISNHICEDELGYTADILSSQPIAMDFKQLESDAVAIKLYQKTKLSLSQVLPIFENMGLKIISENSYIINSTKQTPIYLSIFYVITKAHKLLKIRKIFAESFIKICNKEVENDYLNSLTLTAGLTWKEILILRAYKKYLYQIRFPFDQQYIREVLVKHAGLSSFLLKIFTTKFDPKLNKKSNNSSIEKLAQSLQIKLEQVSSIDEDRIIRQFMALILATLRTNYYQNHSYLSLKINSKNVPLLPLPCPFVEIFIYSINFEAIHLRMAKVARGGLRWSDRSEDFRTEILGLMKAQQVKNAVITPEGAKGGFVLKGKHQDTIACYKEFICGMLDITDNLVNNKMISPQNVVCYDDHDPYLVVAADKGTAGFSDIANQISNERNFWLQDAFASGGSSGYNHKKLGITAKGAFESVKYLFRVAALDYQNTDFTVVGIGDMSGDVFGNGMLLSKHIKLIGAFNHAHIFIDPNPDATISYKERLRLFKLPYSNWTDYNPSLISRGGGIFERSQKSIKLSPEIKQLFNLSQHECTPNELVTSLLKARVDLLWSAGIGTYVKSTTETNEDVHDRSNDAFRINADELQCRVIGEGGNLGLTQKARIQYALNNGLVHTDFIDNSGGVNCSDHEVNIKILLNDLVVAGKISKEQRNTLLINMESEVEKIVLRNNFRQAWAIGLITDRSISEINRFAEIMNRWEKRGIINRDLESLPNNKTLAERKTAGIGLTRPEIAIMFMYAKLFLKKKILLSPIPNKPIFKRYLAKHFPEFIIKNYAKKLNSHKLYREIISTELSNAIITNLGITFIKDVQEETGATIQAIVYAYEITEKLLSLENLVNQIEQMGNTISLALQKKIMLTLSFNMMQTIRWLLANCKTLSPIENILEKFTKKANAIKTNCIKISKFKEQINQELNYLVNNRVSKTLANKIIDTSIVPIALNIIKAIPGKHDLVSIANLYFTLAEKLDLSWLNIQIDQVPINSHWTNVAKAALKSDLSLLQKLLIRALVNTTRYNSKKDEELIISWLEKNAIFAKRWQVIINEIKEAKIVDITMLYVAIRELINLAKSLPIGSPDQA